MKIAIDCMGGDEPAVVRNVRGAVDALGGGARIVLVGRRGEIEKELEGLPGASEDFEIVNAEGVVGMEDSPGVALRRKRDSSLWVLFSMLKEGKVDAVVTAGNTGAAMAMAKMQLGTLPSVDKPAIAAPMPTPRGITVLLDAGANVDSRPGHILQFAAMGAVYSRKAYGAASPRIGLLSIGEEQSKGNELTKQAYGLLENSPLDFYGNVEGGDIFSGKVDVVVCDGFVGNVVLKTAEGFARVTEKILLSELRKDWRGRLGGFLLKSGYKRFKRKISAAGYGGAPLLGINGACMIAHGSSSPAEIKSAVLSARDFIETKLNMEIEQLCSEVLGDKQS